MTEASDGSSPLTRGKRRVLVGARDERRLIPAHAGKTWRRAWKTDWVKAHPRSRGENSPSTFCATAIAGSSPLTRGKRIPAPIRSSGTRLIPAHAGKTESQAAARSLSKAHPRSRGENL